MGNRVRWYYCGLVPALFLLLVACNRSGSTADPLFIELASPTAKITATVVALRPAATATLRPSATATSSPTSTPSPPSSPTAPVSLTVTPTTRPSRTPSPAPPPTRTPEPTATPTASPTALPPTMTQQGTEMRLIDGDYSIMGVAAEVLAEECRRFGRACSPEVLAASQPQHPVWVDSFYMDVYEVTNEQYAAFLNSAGNPESGCAGYDCLLQGSRVRLEGGQYTVDPGFALHPVHSVTWYGATAHCAWRGARLPTEAEWEKAASWQGSSNDKVLYPWGNRFDGSAANFCDITCTQAQSDGAYDDGYAETSPVGSFPSGRSPNRLFDMGGNVWEWVSDWYSPRYYAVSPEANPQGPANGQGRVLRGGSWFDTGNFTATVIRAGLDPARSNDSVGFRCALSP